MIVTVASFKGGVGKTTTSIHLASYLQNKSPTLLIDGDANRSAMSWAERGDLPFKVVDERAAARFARQFDHIVIDTEAHPDAADLKALVEGCDLLVIPTTPDILSLNALLLTVDALKGIGAERYKILLTIIPPRPSRDGDEARSLLKERGLPVFRGEVRRFIAFQKAALAGLPVSKSTDPRANEAWADYEQIGKEILR